MTYTQAIQEAQKWERVTLWWLTYSDRATTTLDILRAENYAMEAYNGMVDAYVTAEFISKGWNI